MNIVSVSRNHDASVAVLSEGDMYIFQNLTVLLKIKG